MGLISKIHELKATRNHTNKVKINNLMIFQCVWKWSLYKISASCVLQCVMAQPRPSCLHTVASAVTVQMLWTCSTGSALDLYFMQALQICLNMHSQAILVKTWGTITMTYPLFDVSAATPSCPTTTIPSHITKSWSTKAKEAWTRYFTKMRFKFHLTGCASTALPTTFLYD